MKVGKNFPSDSEWPALGTKVLMHEAKCHGMDKNLKIFQWLSLPGGCWQPSLFFSVLRPCPPRVPYPHIMPVP